MTAGGQYSFRLFFLREQTCKLPRIDIRPESASQCSVRCCYLNREIAKREGKAFPNWSNLILHVSRRGRAR